MPQDARGVVREARAAHCRDGARAADVREPLLPHAVRELDAQPDGGKNHDLKYNILLPDLRFYSLCCAG